MRNALVRQKKFDVASDILSRCISSQGVSAAGDRYDGQLWTRDLGIAVAPLLLMMRGENVVKRHLKNLSERQRPNGQIPILFLENEERWVAAKRRKSIEQDRPSFMLTRYEAGELWNVTPGTKDSEIIFLLALHEYGEVTGDGIFVAQQEFQARSAHEYIEDHLKVDGLVRGCDWRDTMEKQLADTPLLTNNALYYRALVLMGEHRLAEQLRTRLRESHRPNGRFIDYPGNDRFDPLGGAFAVLYGIADEADYPALVESFMSVDTPRGMTIKCRHNPTNPTEKVIIERTNGVVIWPFVCGFATLALHKMGRIDLAEAQFQKMVELNGFHEWYDPETGRGCGATEQLWSATLYQRAMITLERQRRQSHR